MLSSFSLSRPLCAKLADTAPSFSGRRICFAEMPSWGDGESLDGSYLGDVSLSLFPFLLVGLGLGFPIGDFAIYFG